MTIKLEQVCCKLQHCYIVATKRQIFIIAYSFIQRVSAISNYSKWRFPLVLISSHFSGSGFHWKEKWRKMNRRVQETDVRKLERRGAVLLCEENGWKSDGKISHLLISIALFFHKKEIMVLGLSISHFRKMGIMGWWENNLGRTKSLHGRARVAKKKWCG